MLQSYRILHNNWVQKIQLPTACLRRIRILPQQLDEPYKLNLYHVSYKINQRNQGRKYKILLFHCLPSLMLPDQDRSIINHREGLDQGHQRASQFS